MNEVVANFAGDIDLLLDMDSVDYWVLDALKAVSACVVVAETQTIWGPEFARTVPNDPQYNHEANPDFYGASFAPSTSSCNLAGIDVVGASKYGTNAFSLRHDVQGVFPAAPLEAGFTYPRAREGIESRSERSKHLPWVDV